MKDYRDLLAAANDEQLSAINRPSHCIVQAGPGTGKTRTLVLKAATLLYKDIFPPRSLACITFAKDMAAKLDDEFNQLDLSNNPYIFIGTAHGFCLAHILLPFARLYNYPIHEVIAVPTGLEQLEIYQEIWRYGQFQLRGFSVTDNDRERERLPIRFQKYRRTQLDGRESPNFQPEVERLLIQYEEALIQKGFLDFDLQEKWAMQIVEQKSYVRRSLAAKFPWILVDEYQDMGLPLHRIVKALTEDKTIQVKLFAIGDKNQCIYDFRGADPKYLQELCENTGLYGEFITLKKNYRFSSMVFEASQIVMPSQSLEINRKNRSLGKARVFKTQIVKANVDHDKKLEIFLNDICQRCEIPFSEIMILSFSGERCKRIADYISEKTEIPCFKADKDLYEYRKPLLDWLGKLIVFTIAGKSKPDLRFREIIPFWRQLLILNGWPTYEASSYWQSRCLLMVLENSTRFKDDALAWLEFVDFQLNLNRLLDKYSHRDDIAEYKKFRDALTLGQPLFEYSLEQLLDRIEIGNRVYVGTIHSRKGQESTVTILADAQELQWQNINAGGRQPATEEQRRLFYVALTRAREEVYVIHDGSSTLANQLKTGLNQVVEGSSTIH